MYHSVTGKPSLRVGLFIGLLLGLSLLLLSACGGQGGQAEEGDIQTSLILLLWASVVSWAEPGFSACTLPSGPEW
jgi:hypothetical protein